MGTIIKVALGMDEGGKRLEKWPQNFSREKRNKLVEECIEHVYINLKINR